MTITDTVGEQPAEETTDEVEKPEPEAVTEVESDVDETAASNREAAKYRKQLRTAESSLAEQSEHVAELQTEVVRLMLEGRLTNTKDFDQFVGLERVLGHDGKIDREKLEQEVAALLAERPYLAPAKLAPRMRPKVADGAVGGSAPTKAATGVAKIFGETDLKMVDLLSRHSEHGKSIEAGKKRVKLSVNTEDTD